MQDIASHAAAHHNDLTAAGPVIGHRTLVTVEIPAIEGRSSLVIAMDLGPKAR
jgi:hypothetical protein